MTNLRFAIAFLFLFLASSAAAAAPCVDDTAACQQWVSLGTHGGRSLVYRTFPLDVRNTTITRALVMIHGGNAGAAGHFRVAVEAARLAGALDDTIILAPRIPSNDAYVCLDTLAEGEINWGCQANNGWPAGGTASGDAQLTSYDMTDELLRQLASRNIFPNLRSIVVAGHSAGGQYVTRYAMANQVHERLGVRVTYVVANPAHYAYPDAGRVSESGAERPADELREGCRIYDDWPYGLRDRQGYASRLSEDQLRRQLVSRPVTYLLGAEDTSTLALDTACPAMAQGPNRLTRGQAFARYVNEKFKAGHTVMVVTGCGHNPRCMFTAAPALGSLFGSGFKAQGSGKP